MLRTFLNIIKEYRPWILLLCISNVFFILLAWLAYPETFRLLAGSMIIFSIICIVFGVILVSKRQEKQDKSFYNFLREPSKKHEAELIEAIGKLHKEKVKYLADRLRSLNDQFDEAKLQALDYEEFIEGWVHEIKTPISLAALVLENRKEEMSQLAYQRLEHARINISDNVEQILFYARLKVAHVDYRVERISLITCCEDVQLELQSLLDEKEVKVVYRMKDIPIVSDKRSLQFILMQIFVNAVKYSNEKIDSFIFLETGLNTIENRYYLKISDNGLGVLSADLPFIFDKGFTGDNTNRSKSSGIGLYLVKKLCDQLQIEIEVEAEYGKGFAIQLLFPIVDNAEV